MYLVPVPRATRNDVIGCISTLKDIFDEQSKVVGSILGHLKKALKWCFPHRHLKRTVVRRGRDFSRRVSEAPQPLASPIQTLNRRTSALSTSACCSSAAIASSS